MSAIRNRPSQLLENLSPYLRVSLRIRQTKFLGLTFELYLLVARILPAFPLILALSLNSLMRSSTTSKLFCRSEGSPISTGIIASVPYVRLYGVS